jgi:hypothetical protein
METCISAPILARVKFWQLVALGIAGWCALYSTALITWGTGRAAIGHAQGACFAAAMVLAGWEARRCKKKLPNPPDPLQWAHGLCTEQINQTIALNALQKEIRVEPSLPQETDLGFGVRTVNAGRIVVFETSRWREPVINARHVQTADVNRQLISAAHAIIVGAGQPDRDAQTLARSRPVSFLCGKEFKNMFDFGLPLEGTTEFRSKTSRRPAALRFFPRLAQRCRSAFTSARRH